MVCHADVQKQQEANGPVSRLVWYRERTRGFDLDGREEEAGPTAWHKGYGIRSAAVGIKAAASVLHLFKLNEAVTKTPREKHFCQFVFMKAYKSRHL